MIIGSKNKGKIKEIKIISDIYGLKYSFQTYPDIDIPEIDETGKSFSENAIIKAEKLFEIYKRPVITDDSGLSVDFLGGFPGVYSARYSRKGDNGNIDKLLTEMKNLPVEKRNAEFFCTVCFCFDYKSYVIFSGNLKGVIDVEKKGSNGFGYDPVFFIPEYGKTLAEISSEQKNKISHRARAFNKLFNFLSKNTFVC